jgi:hypothetical protein
MHRKYNGILIVVMMAALGLACVESMRFMPYIKAHRNGSRNGVKNSFTRDLFRESEEEIFLRSNSAQMKEKRIQAAYGAITTHIEKRKMAPISCHLDWHCVKIVFIKPANRSAALREKPNIHIIEVIMD